MEEIIISQKQARQFALECYDAIVQGIKAMEEKQIEDEINGAKDEFQEE